MASCAAKSIEEILARTEINPRKVAIENVEFPFEVTRDLVDQYNTSICFDTGHLLTRYSGDESVLEFYKRHRDRIVEIHLHDGSYEKIGDNVVHRDHMALGRGAMPVREFLKELVKDRFNRPVVFELTAAEAKESLEKIRAVVPEALK
jgi:sugar phosphate isomerase/epimerase